MRASDADRAAVAQRLQRAVDEGRLDINDYDERLQQAYAAKTYGELARVTADLPAPVVDKALVKAQEKAVAKRAEMAGEWRSWAGTSAVLIAIWGFTSIASGSFLFFWPMFPVGIWGVILLAQMFENHAKDG